MQLNAVYKPHTLPSSPLSKSLPAEGSTSIAAKKAKVASPESARRWSVQLSSTRKVSEGVNGGIGSTTGKTKLQGKYEVRARAECDVDRVKRQGWKKIEERNGDWKREG